MSALPTMFFISGKNDGGYVKQEISGFTEQTRLREIIALGIGHESDEVGNGINKNPLQAEKGNDEVDDMRDAIVTAASSITCNSCEGSTSKLKTTSGVHKPTIGTIPTIGTCNSCEDCTNKLESGLYDTVILTADITDHAGSCISLLLGESNAMFDCNGHTIDGDDFAIDPDHGVAMMHGSGNTIKNCVISDFSEGIYLWDTTNHVITNNNVISNVDGIRLGFSGSNAINNNIVNDNYNGIVIDNSNNNIINANIACKNTNLDINIVSGSGNAGNNNYCDKPDGWSDTRTIGCTYSCTAPTCGCVGASQTFVCGDTVTESCTLNCNLTSTGTCFTIGEDDITIDGAGYCITGDTTGHGVYLNGKSGNTIKNCVVTGFRDGIYLRSSSHNTITNNIANSNNNGISLSSSSNNTIIDNTANSNGWSGIPLDYSSNNTIINNIANSNNYFGIYLHSPPNNNNLITSNTANNNQRHGLYIYSFSTIGNTINSNTFCNNSKSGGAYYDIYDEGSNPGDENTCDTTYNWNDAETTGCTYSCLGKPDLVITEIKCDRENDRIGYRIENIGEAAATESHHTALLVKFGEAWEEMCYDHVSVDLSPGEDYQGWFECYTWPECQTIEVKVCADRDNAVEESDEDNNCLERICECCVTPTDDLYINFGTTLCPGFYNIPDTGANGVIIINADDVVLDCNGATLKGDNSGYGIYNPGFDNVTIKNGNVLNYGNGIHLFGSDNSIISNNNVSYSGNRGISIEGSHHCDVYGNSVSFSGDRGIVFEGGGNNAVYNNIVYNNSAYGAIEAISSDNNEIYNNIAYFNRWGIATNHGSNNQIYGNIIYGNELGVYLDWPSTNNRVFNNNISSNRKGIWTNHNSTDNIIAGNLIFSNEYAGIHIETDNNTVTNNTANNNRIGLYLCADSTGNTVNYNIFCNNSRYDVQDEDSNSGDENTCDLTDNWNDAGTTGCSFGCPHTTVECTSCKDCSDKISSGNYNTVFLANNIIDAPGSCIEFNSNNTTFDGQGFTT